MITKLQIENFKSWRKTGDLRFAPLTGFFGSNSSGKTSLLQLLLMLKQTVESPDRKQVLNLGDDQSLVSLGTFRDIIFEHDRNTHLSWSLSWTPNQNPDDLLFYRSKFDFESEISEEGSQLIVNRFRYDFGDNSASFAMGAMGDKLDGSVRYAIESKRADMTKVIRGGPSPIKFYGFPDQIKARSKYSEILSDVELKFTELFSSLFYIGPLREYPKRYYTWAGNQPTDAGYRGEKAVDAILAIRQGDFKISVEKRVAQWLHELGLIHTFSIKALTKESNLYQVLVRRTPGSAEVLLTDVGFGVSQILPVLVLCYYAPEGSTLVLEQPEIHLHPSVQAGLADVFIDAIRTRGIQIILESHSEYLVKRLLRRIAEGDSGITNEDVSLYFCKMNERESKIDPLDVDPLGNIRNWPTDFFGNEMEDLAARTRAAMRRKQGIAE